MTDTPPHERQPFCPQCGLVDKIDANDGTCGHCGTDTCGLDQLREYLAAHGLHVVGGAEKAVLDACAQRGLSHDLWCEQVLDAELARRGLKP